MNAKPVVWLDDRDAFRNRTYADLRRESKARDEDNDCCVIAFAVVAQASYAAAHAALKAHGRKARGTHERGSVDIWAALRVLGFDATSEARHPKTVAAFEKAKMPGRWLLSMWSGGTEHIAAAVDGKVYDWSAGDDELAVYALHLVKPRQR